MPFWCLSYKYIGHTYALHRASGGLHPIRIPRLPHPYTSPYSHIHFFLHLICLNHLHFTPWHGSHIFPLMTIPCIALALPPSAFYIMQFALHIMHSLPTHAFPYFTHHYNISLHPHTHSHTLHSLYHTPHSTSPIGGVITGHIPFTRPFVPWYPYAHSYTFHRSSPYNPHSTPCLGLHLTYDIIGFSIMLALHHPSSFSHWYSFNSPTHMSLVPAYICVHHLDTSTICWITLYTYTIIMWFIPCQQ